MPSYRIYYVETGGRLRVGDTLQAADDTQAAATARALLPPEEAAELWEGGRRVGCFAKDGVFTRG